MAARQMLRQTRFAYLALAVVSVLATLSLLEMGVRLISPVLIYGDTPDFYSPAPEIGYALKENAVKRMKMREFDYVITTNSRGFRGPEFAENPRPGTERILLLGDSFTFGWGVNFDETYGSVLEESLSRLPGKRAEVINGGVPGFSTLNELMFLKHRGLALKPRLVVLQFLLNDDIEHNLIRPVNFRSVIDHTLVTSSYIEKVREKFPPTHQLTIDDFLEYEASLAQRSLYEKIKATLFTHSHLYRFVVSRVPTEQVEAVKNLLRQIGFDIQYDNAERLSRSSIEIYEEPIPLRMQQALTVTRSLLLQMAEAVHRADAELVVVIFPGLLEVDEESRQRVFRRLGMTEEQISVTKVRERLADYCRQQGILLFDLLPAFQRAHQDGARLFFPIDGHFNQAGYRLAGEALAAFIRKNSLLDGAVKTADIEGANLN